jgi:hypothetical protein
MIMKTEGGGAKKLGGPARVYKMEDTDMEENTTRLPYTK